MLQIKLICCLAFVIVFLLVFEQLYDDVVNGKLNSPNILSLLSSVSKVEFVNIG